MSSCQSNLSEEVEKMAAKRSASLKKEIHKYLLNVCVQDVLVNSGLGGHLDAALHLDRKKLLIESLRSVADDLERLDF